MQIGKNPGQKRQIGPAMQWAKPRTASGAATDGPTPKIELDFNEEQHRGSSTTPGQNASDESLPSNNVEQNGGAYNSTSAARYNSDNSGSRRRSWAEAGSPAEDQQSAWEYYAEGIGTDPYSQDIRSGQKPHDGYSGTIPETNKTTNNVSLTQYLLPLLVVVVIVVVGVLASLG